MRFTALITFLVSTMCSAQGFKVKPSVPGSLSHYSGFVFEKTSGDYIAGGITTDTLHGKVINRITLIGLDNNGAVIWTKKHGNERLIYTYNPFITRSFYKQGNFIYYAGYMLDSTNTGLGTLVKFDMNGDTVWQKIYRDSLQHDLVPQMVTGSEDGGFLITGYAVINNPCLLIKTDSQGNELWRKRITTFIQDGKAIIQDSATKKIIIAGNKSVSGKTFENILILDSLGNNPSYYDYSGFGGVFADLIQTKDKSFIAIGSREYPQTVGGTNLIKSFIVKFDINNPKPAIWQINDFDKLELNNYFYCIRELNNGDLIIGGFIDTLQLHNQPTNILTRITKFDKDGNLIFNRYYDYKTNSSTSDNYQSVVSLELTSDGGVVAAIKVQNFPGSNPFFFVKYDSTGCDSTLAYCSTLNAVGLNENKNGTARFKIYPNPSKDLLIVEDNFSGLAELAVFDVSGREVKKLLLEQSSRIDLSELETGVYLIKLFKGSEIIYTGKFLKE